MEENFLHLPPLFNDLNPPFIGVHLNALYKQSYSCILHGLYHAGIVLMSQLLEETVREIIRINTGIPHKGDFDKLLGAVKKLSGETTPYFIHPILIDQITKIKEQIRNPYIHMRYSKLFKGETTAAALVKIPFNPVGSIRDSDEIKPEMRKLDIGMEPVISSIFKEDYDKKLAFELAWEIFGLYWLLLELYLTQDKYEKSIQKFGSFIDKLPPWKEEHQ